MASNVKTFISFDLQCVRRGTKVGGTEGAKSSADWRMRKRFHCLHCIAPSAAAYLSSVDYPVCKCGDFLNHHISFQLISSGNFPHISNKLIKLQWSAEHKLQVIYVSLCLEAGGDS